MTCPNDVLHEAKRLRLLAPALEPQHFTSMRRLSPECD